MTDRETERLILRQPILDDRDDMARLWGDPEVTRFFPGGRPMQPDRSEAGLYRFIVCWKRDGYGPWMLIEKETGRWIGYCGLRFLAEVEETELLYGIDPDFWNRGLTTEAARESLRHGFEEIELKRVVAFAFPQNVASTRVMEHVGMRYVCAREIFGIDAVEYRLTRTQWERSRG